jgi:FKBP-type peptidyl-prolyl cis-trans isomerase
MKKIIPLTVVLFAVILSFSSCKKNSNFQSTVDHERIAAYVKANNLQGQYTASGIFYVIDTAGTIPHPTISSTVTVDYKGTLLDGTVFDQHNDISFPLSQVIKGWQEGIPLIGPGGKILLIIPSGLGYGSKQKGSIPANSVLVFDVTLHSFTN